MLKNASLRDKTMMLLSIHTQFSLPGDSIPHTILQHRGSNTIVSESYIPESYPTRVTTCKSTCPREIKQKQFYKKPALKNTFLNFTKYFTKKFYKFYKKRCNVLIPYAFHISSKDRLKVDSISFLTVN